MPAQASGSGTADGAAVEAATAQAASLSLADSSLPLWFKPELFVAPEFNPVAYVADLKRYVSTCRRSLPWCCPPVSPAYQALSTKQRHLQCWLPLAGATGDAEQRAALPPGCPEEQAGGGGCCAQVPARLARFGT